MTVDLSTPVQGVWLWPRALLRQSSQTPKAGPVFDVVLDGRYPMAGKTSTDLDTHTYAHTHSSVFECTSESVTRTRRRVPSPSAATLPSPPLRPKMEISRGEGGNPDQKDYTTFTTGKSHPLAPPSDPGLPAFVLQRHCPRVPQ